MSTRDIGRLGEAAAAHYLETHGFTILQQNAYIGHLEVDIIARDSTHLIFAEVKTRRARPDTKNRFGRPADAVNFTKRDRLMRAVQLWRRDHPGEYSDLIPNIDIVEVYTDPNFTAFSVLAIRHYRNAVNGMKGVLHETV